MIAPSIHHSTNKHQYETILELIRRLEIAEVKAAAHTTDLLAQIG